MAEIYLAGGCFWGTEKYMSSIRGVLKTSVGYANGSTENPTYEEVCYKDTGHAEAVKVEYDPGVIKLSFLLALFFESIDPFSQRAVHSGGSLSAALRSSPHAA